jgi:hypothetical protein
MKSLFLGTLFVSTLAFAGGGDVVNNGGGLSEQALMFSAQHFLTFAESCLHYDSCGARPPMNQFLNQLKTCSLPTMTDFRFSTPKETPELQGRAFVLLPNHQFVIHRQLLYSSSNEPLRMPEAMGYLARIYFDHCHQVPFAQSSEIAKVLAGFVEADGEQVTIGKDSVNLPAKEWLHIRTLYSDLIFEGPKSLLRLSCPTGSLDSCSLVSTQDSKTASRFKNLSLTQEEQRGGRGGVLHFEVEGTFLANRGTRLLFKLSAEYKDGKPLQVRLQNQALELPKEDPKGLVLSGF